MTGLYVVELLLVVAALAGLLWVRRAGDQAWAQHQRTHRRRTGTVRVDLALDATQFLEAMRRASESASRLARVLSRRRCGCPEMAEHTRDCPDHPANRGWRSRVRWESRRWARRWHRWRRTRLVEAADRHDWSALDGRWRR